MLARLDRELHPVRASVNREGTALRIEGERIDAERVVAIVASMGSTAAPSDPASVERWFGSADVDELSREEADVLTHRFVEDMRTENVVEAPERAGVVVRDSLLGSFRDAARTGRLGEIALDHDRLRASMGEPDATTVMDWLRGRMRLE